LLYFLTAIIYFVQGYAKDSINNNSNPKEYSVIQIQLEALFSIDKNDIFFTFDMLGANFTSNVGEFYAIFLLSSSG
jgi:hypothetical protein